jgi:hypothetical protein
MLCQPNRRLVCTRRAGLHQCLILLPECLAVHPQLLGLREPATTGSAGVACDRTPEQICLPDGPASLSQRMGRERGAHPMPREQYHGPLGCGMPYAEGHKPYTRSAAGSRRPAKAAWFRCPSRPGSPRRGDSARAPRRCRSRRRARPRRAPALRSGPAAHRARSDTPSPPQHAFAIAPHSR